MRLLIFAISTAYFAVSATASVVNMRVAENPHDPPTRARMPMPYESVLDTPVICFSRVVIYSNQWRLILASP